MTGSTVQPANTAQPIILEKTANKPAVSVIIEDWQLAGKYKRRPISQEEIDFINVTYFYYTEYYLCNNIFIFFHREEAHSDLFTRH